MHFSFDRPSSLAAFLQPDPEELLYSLGFGGQTSLLQIIPERFFVNNSEARGIDVNKIYDSLLIDETQVRRFLLLSHYTVNNPENLS